MDEVESWPAKKIPELEGVIKETCCDDLLFKKVSPDAGEFFCGSFGKGFGVGDMCDLGPLALCNHFGTINSFGCFYDFCFIASKSVPDEGEDNCCEHLFTITGSGEYYCAKYRKGFGAGDFHDCGPVAFCGRVKKSRFGCFYDFCQNIIQFHQAEEQGKE